MTGCGKILAFGVLAISMAYGQQASAPAMQANSAATSSAADPKTAAPQPSANSTPGDGQTAGNPSIIPIQLSKSLDAKKLKAGDPVQAKTAAELRTGNGTVIPSGSTVKGHISEASARSKGAEQSTLGMAFDKIQLKNGQELPLRATIQAIGPPPQPASTMEEQPTMSAPGNPGTNPGANAGGAPLGGAASAGGFPNPPSSPTQTVPASNGQQGTAPMLTAQSTGVVGLRNLQLGPNSRLTSTGKDLKLDAGTEMILRVQSQ